MRRGHIPKRTCRGCGSKKPQQELVRFVMVDSRLVADHLKILPGRAVYCCENDDCRKRLEKNKKMLKRAFRLMG